MYLRPASTPSLRPSSLTERRLHGTRTPFPEAIYDRLDEAVDELRTRCSGLPRPGRLEVAQPTTGGRAARTAGELALGTGHVRGLRQCVRRQAGGCRVRSVWRDRRDAERVAGRVEKHAPSNVELRIELDGAQTHRSGRLRIDVRAGRKIEMDDRHAGPSGPNVGSDPLRHEGDAGNPYARAGHVLPQQLPAEQLEVERRQGRGVSTVE